MPSVAIIGGGPAGLMAAEAVVQGAGSHEVNIDMYDAMPSMGRKFLLAGKGGLNLTHSEPPSYSFTVTERSANASLRYCMHSGPTHCVRGWKDSVSKPKSAVPAASFRPE